MSMSHVSITHFFEQLEGIVKKPTFGDRWSAADAVARTEILKSSLSSSLDYQGASTCPVWHLVEELRNSGDRHQYEG